MMADVCILPTDPTVELSSSFLFFVVCLIRFCLIIHVEKVGRAPHLSLDSRRILMDAGASPSFQHAAKAVFFLFERRFQSDCFITWAFPEAVFVLGEVFWWCS